jgi:flagellar hook-associated protein 1 FlgK
MAGLFDTFTIAKRGLFVQQGAINTTAHNISNANTEGFSRQRAVVETTKPFGGMSRFDTTSAGQVGTGAQITTIQRIRDSFIDYQVRSETGKSGYYATESDALSKVEGVFAEPSDKGIQELMNQFFNAFQEVSKSPDKSDVKTVAIQKASSLADALNYAYNQLEQNCKDSQGELQTNVIDANSTLEQINELNKQIRGVSAVGQSPNDLMDKRDNLIDKLSNQFGIKLDKDKFETINLASTEYPNSTFVKSDPNDLNYSRLSYVDSAVADTTAGTVTMKYYPLGNKNAQLETVTINATPADAQSLADELTQCRILITNKDGELETTASGASAPVGNNGNIGEAEFKTKIFQTYKYETYASGAPITNNNVDNKNVKGDIAANQAVQENIRGYMDQLNKLAAGLAYSVNAIQVGSLGAANANLSSDKLIFVTYDDTTKANTTSDDKINAQNIRINNVLVTDPTKLNCNTTSTSGAGDGSRVKAIANLNIIKMDFSNITSTTDFNDRKTFLGKIGINATTTGFTDTNCLSLDVGTNGSTMDSYYKSTINKVAVDNQEAARMSGNQDTILADLEQQKSSVSGVSLDEETTNLIQFQHAYQANAKMISTIDELLDVVINQLKR